MDVVATILAAAAFATALLLYFKPPPWIRKLLPSLDNVKLTPELLGGALRHFFSGQHLTDEEGNEVELSPQNAAFVFAEGLVSRAIAELYPRVAEDVPQFLAMVKKPSLAKELQAESALARGFDKLGSGLNGVQPIQAMLNQGMEAIGKGAMGGKGGMGLGFLGDLMPMYQQAKDLGIIAGPGDDNGSNSQSQSPPSSGGDTAVPLLGSPVG